MWLFVWQYAILGRCWIKCLFSCLPRQYKCYYGFCWMGLTLFFYMFLCGVRYVPQCKHLMPALVPTPWIYLNYKIFIGLAPNKVNSVPHVIWFIMVESDHHYGGIRPSKSYAWHWWSHLFVFISVFNWYYISQQRDICDEFVNISKSSTK